MLGQRQANGLLVVASQTVLPISGALSRMSRNRVLWEVASAVPTYFAYPKSTTWAVASVLTPIVTRKMATKI